MVISEAVYWQAIGAAKKDLKQLLIALWNTGARPLEFTRLHVDGVDWTNASVTLKQHKTKKRTGRVRIIHLSPDALAALEVQRKKYGEGLLFRTGTGTQWRNKALAQAVWRLSKRIGHRVTAYGCRHSWITRALELGFPDTHVAAAAGHSNTKMIHLHYSHINQSGRLLKDMVAKVESSSAKPA